MSLVIFHAYLSETLIESIFSFAEKEKNRGIKSVCK